MTSGHRLFCKGFRCFNTVPCRIMPSLVHFRHTCHILPFQPILWNRCFPSKPVRSSQNSPKSISEGGRIWQVCSQQSCTDFAFISTTYASTIHKHMMPCVLEHWPRRSWGCLPLLFVLLAARIYYYYYITICYYVFMASMASMSEYVRGAHEDVRAARRPDACGRRPSRPKGWTYTYYIIYIYIICRYTLYIYIYVSEHIVIIIVIICSINCNSHE